MAPIKTKRLVYLLPILNVNTRNNTVVFVRVLFMYVCVYDCVYKWVHIWVFMHACVFVCVCCEYPFGIIQMYIQNLIQHSQNRGGAVGTIENIS